MSTNYYQQNPKRLRSPLLDGLSDKVNEARVSKIKKTYFNLKEEKKINDPIDEALDKTLFSNLETLPLPKETKKKETINHSHILSLELSFKIASILIWATGGILSLLELINVIRVISVGSLNFGNSLVVFTVGLIGTVLASVICQGFIHLVRVTRYLYLSSEEQKLKLNNLLSSLNSNPKI